MKAYQPFPTEIFPPPIQRLIEDGAESIGVDPAYISLPLLSALGAAIGNARTIGIKSDWTEPANLWTALVASSGTAKSAAQRLALRSLHRRQADLWQDHKQALADHKAATKEWKAQPSADRGEQPDDPPTCEHLFCSDVTVEALAARLDTSPRGLLVAADELAGWFKSWNAYKNGGSDRESYLSFYDAAPAKIDRKGAMPPTIYIPRAFVAVTGGIQPGILRRLLIEDLFDSGLVGRILFAAPPETPVTWRDKAIPHEVLVAVDDIFSRLWAMMPGDGEPVVMPLTDAAREAFAEFVNDNGRVQASFEDDNLKAAWAKLRGAAARIALVLQCANVASGTKGIDDRSVDHLSVVNGINLAKWFGHEARRLYGDMRETVEDRERRKLIELVQARGGAITIRDLQRGPRRYRDDYDLAEGDLQALVEAGLGSWEYPPAGARGGHPAKRFRLAEDTTGGDGTPIIDPANGGCVTVATSPGGDNGQSRGVDLW